MLVIGYALRVDLSDDESGYTGDTQSSKGDKSPCVTRSSAIMEKYASNGIAEIGMIAMNRRFMKICPTGRMR